jgi:hypothetical protein
MICKKISFFPSKPTWYKIACLLSNSSLEIDVPKKGHPSKINKKEKQPQLSTEK